MSYNVKKREKLFRQTLEQASQLGIKRSLKQLTVNFGILKVTKNIVFTLVPMDEEQQLIPVMLIFLLNYLRMNTIAITFIREMGSPDYCKL